MLLIRFLHLPAADQWLLAQSWFLLMIVRLGLWLLSFQRLLHILSRVKRNSQAEEKVDETLINRVVWSVDVASRYVPSATCLVRALVTQIMLAHRGYPTNLQIGVARNEEGKFEAHAWIESQGQVIIGGLEDLTRYNPLPPLEGL